MIAHQIGSIAAGVALFFGIAAILADVAYRETRLTNDRRIFDNIVFIAGSIVAISLSVVILCLVILTGETL